MNGKKALSKLIMFKTFVLVTTVQNVSLILPRTLGYADSDLVHLRYSQFQSEWR